jgi:uncharacterized membrane-anchored protein
MASTFLTRLVVGGRLVSAASVARLHRSKPSGRLLAVMLACQLGALGAGVAVVGGPTSAWDDVRHGVERTAERVAGLVPGGDR